MNLNLTVPFYKLMSSTGCADTMTEYRTFSVFTACLHHDLVLSVHCHWGDAINPKVTSYHISWLNQTKQDVGEDCNSSKLLKRFVIILGCDFHFNVIRVYKTAECHSTKEWRVLGVA